MIFVKRVILSLLILVPQVYATEVIVFDCRRPIAMSDKEKPQKDFYLNAGVEMGLKKGVTLNVQRRVPLYNTVTNSSAGDLQLHVAKIKIIHVQNRLSVARLVNENTPMDLPILEDSYILIGDRVDLGSAASAEAETPAPSFAPQQEASKQPEPIKEPAKEPTSEPTVKPVEPIAAVDLKVESTPTILDNKSIERQTATLDNPTLQ